jgi:hypothetical protein
MLMVAREPVSAPMTAGDADAPDVDEPEPAAFAAGLGTVVDWKRGCWTRARTLTDRGTGRLMQRAVVLALDATRFDNIVAVVKRGELKSQLRHTRGARCRTGWMWCDKAQLMMGKQKLGMKR